MYTASNEITSSPSVYDVKIQAVSPSSPPIPWRSETSPEIRLTPHKPIKTPSLRKPHSLTVLSISRDTEISGWCLKSIMLVQIRHSRRETVATTWLEGVAEYGTGQGEAEAITDLVVSLGEYRESLEKQENKLGGSAQRELNYLRRLIECSQVSSSSR